MITVGAPAAIAFGAPASTILSPCRAAGRPPIITVNTAHRDHAAEVWLQTVDERTQVKIGIRPPRRHSADQHVGTTRAGKQWCSVAGCICEACGRLAHVVLLSSSHKEAQKAQGFAQILCATCASLWLNMLHCQILVNVDERTAKRECPTRFDFE
jgi:hypothetical protein